ncbi:hypothetical protein C3432_24910 [Citrobacter amalonaticus]|uniref:Uncharacterized protein n=1 Tax=Citrobacter amalonaticus TaxID=35703 RepID=A0A2S4RS60_CITAM|nr:hypothetical protein C3432_24910 [Citrobacter amalonaticus]POT70801.1 hypothetical protein C3436_23970 [Citrobacter amalonaticus]POU62418.1 hypothetical protein C3430_22200 [Citrobacter amalonaticus]POV02856.1 hypothetical protein C3424_23805 [Citrobacter amalonaticus]
MVALFNRVTRTFHHNSLPAVLITTPVFAWEPQISNIIFQISRSSQSKAIPLATHSDYSLTGTVVMRYLPVSIRVCKHKKSAFRRFFLAAETYLLPGMLKRLLKRSTRPPVATSRCLPV